MFKSEPDYCGKPITAPAPECQSCRVVDKCKNTISKETQINTAIEYFVKIQSQIRSSIDSATGCTLGKHFSVSIIVVGTPSLRTDGSLDLTVVCNFIPLENVIAPTKEHQRVYCPAIKGLLTKLANFNDSDSEKSSCDWKNYAHESKKRGLLQASSESSTTFTVATNFPKSAVDRVYAVSASSNDPLPASTAEPIGQPTSSESTVARSMLVLVLVAVFAVLFL